MPEGTLLECTSRIRLDIVWKYKKVKGKMLPSVKRGNAQRGPTFSKDIPTPSTQPRAIPAPSDHVTHFHARSRALRAHSLEYNCTRTNDPRLDKKRFSFAQKTRLPPVYPTNIRSIFAHFFFSRFDFRATFAVESIVRCAVLNLPMDKKWQNNKKRTLRRPAN